MHQKKSILGLSSLITCSSIAKVEVEQEEMVSVQYLVLGIPLFEVSPISIYRLQSAVWIPRAVNSIFMPIMLFIVEGCY